MQARKTDTAGYPDKRVAMAIVQAYLASKDSGLINWTKGWGLNFQEDEMDLTIPAKDTTAREKFDTCGKILNKISCAGNDFNQWVNLLHHTYAIAVTDREQAGRFSSTGLAQTMDALRDYIHGELKDLQEFEELKKATDKELSILYQQVDDRVKREGFDKKELEGPDGLNAQLEAKKVENEALNSVPDALNKEQFFKSWISTTSAAQELGEKTFNDFVSKVKSNEHVTDLASASLAKYNELNTTGTVLGKPKAAKKQNAKEKEEPANSKKATVSKTHGTLLGRPQTARTTLSKRQRRKLRQAQDGQKQEKITRSGRSYGSK